MTTKELLEACLEAWKLDKEENYKLVLVRADKQIEVPLERNGKRSRYSQRGFLRNRRSVSVM